jgi:hypothetical protein
MPRSESKNKHWSLKQIKKIRPESILDVGTGAGDWETLVRSIFSYEVKIDGVEIWKPYFDRYSLVEKYNEMFNRSAQEHQNYSYDLVIFGDVLEHMTIDDALLTFNKAKKQANYVLVSVPTINHPQGVHHQNPFETHLVDDYTVEKFIGIFGKPKKIKTFPVTSVFLYKFKSNKKSFRKKLKAFLSNTILVPIQGILSLLRRS